MSRTDEFRRAMPVQILRRFDAIEILMFAGSVLLITALAFVY